MKLNKLSFCITLFLQVMLVGCLKYFPAKNNELINTVNGSILPKELKFALTHEHIMSNFGKDQNEASFYDEKLLLEQVIPYLRKLKSLGVHSIFDCTAKHFGRRVDLLKLIADSTGVQIITNTGIYGAANDKYIPKYCFDLKAEDISKKWIHEYTNGIEDTQIKPGFIKLAFDKGTPSEIDTKLFIAGILTHKKTGLKLAVHTGNNLEAAKLQIELLKKYKTAPSAWIWVHANTIKKIDVLLDYASKGVWISLDGIKTTNILEYIEFLKKFKAKKLLHKVLLSHDGNSFPSGGKIRKFEAIMTSLIPAMLKNGFTKKEINQIMIYNPQNAFKVVKSE